MAHPGDCRPKHVHCERRMDGWTDSTGPGGYCLITRRPLTASFSSNSSISCPYNSLPTKGWPGWVDLGGWLQIPRWFARCPYNRRSTTEGTSFRQRHVANTPPLTLSGVCYTARSIGTVHTSAKARLSSVATSVPPSGESVRDLCPLTTFCISQ